MLKVRIIPKLLLKQGRNVKGIKFTGLRDVGHPVTTARIYNAQGADELLFLDITASTEHRPILYEIITRTAQELFMPFCVGGGVRTLEDVRSLLRAGADKVAINTAAVATPTLIADAATRFGSQCIVVSIDFRREEGRGIVYTHGGAVRTDLEVVPHARRMAEMGAGEILLTSIDRDGTMEGYDVDMIADVTRAVRLPVIASGGAGTLQHLVDACVRGQTSAVAVGSLFHFTDQSPIKARMFMRMAGVDVRI